MKVYNHILGFLTIAASMFFTSCEDTIDYSKQVIGDGNATIDATIEFKSEVTSIGGSRSSGTAISEIKDLNVVIYNNDGSLYDVKYLTGLTSTEIDNTPSDYPQGDDVKSEPKTRRVSFNMTIPYGRYYMYSVANLGRNLGAENASDEDKAAIKTPEGLKAIRCTWNPTDISANAQMFGYFTNGSNGSNTTAYEEPTPTVLVNDSHVALHSWIKRLASKVTIAYDGSGLHNGIYVYIHNVSIRQIPLSCTLGDPNKPASEDEVTPARFDQSVPDTAQVIYYDSKGNITQPSEYNTDNHDDWMIVAKGNGIIGSDHSNTAQALFFYENMQGDYKDNPNKQWFNKVQNRDSVGINIEPGMDDYRDNVPYGTFIEVEAYYQCDTIPLSNGPIRYRFMLGQDTEYNYDAIRNHHYKVTLGFNGYANQPDWHIEYKEMPPEVFANEVYIPYTYNTSVEYPITIKGNITTLTAEIIENNWAPYDETDTQYEVAPETSGLTNFDDRTLEFMWWRDLYINANGYQTEVNMETVNFNSSQFTNNQNNYLYGRHPSPYYHLKDDPKAGERYYVTPIWAGFLRLQVPEQYNNESVSMPASIIRNLGQAGSAAQYGAYVTNDSGVLQYNGRPVLNQFRNYYYGSNFEPMSGDDDIVNTTDLHRRVFRAADLTDGQHGTGRNSYRVIRTVDKEGIVSTTLILKFWTQPKSMCGISGFSGNNPYEDYNRKAVIRFTADFEEGEKVERDITVFQTKRMTNPKAVWRSHSNPEPGKTTPDPFNVVLYQRVTTGTRNTFEPMISQGAWRAYIKSGDKSFIKLVPSRGASISGDTIIGNTLSAVDFTINFVGEIDYTDSKCAIVEVDYHGNTCVHNVFVRQGYHQPLQLTTEGPYWSSYNVFSCNDNPTFGTQTEVNATLTRNPLAFGAFFKKGNYTRAIAVSNIENSAAGFGPLGSPGDNPFVVTGTSSTYRWSYISGIQSGTTSITGYPTFNDATWHWADFKVTLNDGNNTERTYSVPTISEYQTLLEGDFGIGVIYGDGATAPATSTGSAFGFLDNANSTVTSKNGMRGFICYNPDNGNNIIFPIGTSGLGRRTIQLPRTTSQRGTLRYGSTFWNLNEYNAIYNSDKSRYQYNSLRPIPVNMSNAPGAIYWAHQRDTEGYVAWDMNYFDLNFNGSRYDVVSRTDDGGYGDALPIRLVIPYNR